MLPVPVTATVSDGEQTATVCERLEERAYEKETRRTQVGFDTSMRVEWTGCARRRWGHKRTIRFDSEEVGHWFLTVRTRGLKTELSFLPLLL